MIGDKVIKPATGKVYIYYRCTMYNHSDHPQVGLREQQINDQVLVLFARLKQEDTVRDWFTRRIREWATY